MPEVAPARSDESDVPRWAQFADYALAVGFIIIVLAAAIRNL